MVDKKCSPFWTAGPCGDRRGCSQSLFSPFFFTLSHMRETGSGTRFSLLLLSPVRLVLFPSCGSFARWQPHVAAEKAAHLLKRLPPFGQDSSELLEDVPQIIPHSQLDRNIGGSGMFRDEEGVIEKHFVPTNINPQRGEATEIRVQRRKQRIAEIFCASREVRQSVNRVCRKDGIDRFLRSPTLHGTSKIAPWREQCSTSRLRKVPVTHGLQQSQGQATTSGVTSERDLIRRISLLKEPLVGRECIVERGRKDMLGSQAIVNQQRRETRRSTQTCHQITMRLG